MVGSRDGERDPCPHPPGGPRDAQCRRHSVPGLRGPAGGPDQTGVDAPLPEQGSDDGGAGGRRHRPVGGAAHRDPRCRARRGWCRRPDRCLRPLRALPGLRPVRRGGVRRPTAAPHAGGPVGGADDAVVVRARGCHRDHAHPAARRAAARRRRLVRQRHRDARAQPRGTPPVGAGRRGAVGGCPVTRWMLLGAAIVSEVAGSLALKAALGHAGWYLLVVVGYTAAFVLILRALWAGLGLGVAYGIWGAMGVALTALFGALLFGEIITAVLVLGLVLGVGRGRRLQLGSQRALATRSRQEAAG